MAKTDVVATLKTLDTSGADAFREGDIVQMTANPTRFRQGKAKVARWDPDRGVFHLKGIGKDGQVDSSFAPPHELEMVEKGPAWDEPDVVDALKAL